MQATCHGAPGTSGVYSDGIRLSIFQTTKQFWACMIDCGMRVTRQDLEAMIRRFGNGEPITRLCQEYSLDRYAFYKAVFDDPDVLRIYESAQAGRAEHYVEEIIDIADNSLDPMQARNRIDARRWYAEKMRPSRYGQKLDVNVQHTVDLSGALRDLRARLPQTVKVLPITRLITNNNADAVEGNALDSKPDEDDDIFK